MLLPSTPWIGLSWTVVWHIQLNGTQCATPTKSKSMHAKHERLSMEVQRLEKLLGYDDKSTGNMSSSSSSSDEDIDQYIDANDHDSA
jgi:hypothetical protein